MRAIILLCLLVLPAFAQAQTAGQTTGPAPVPLPTWFVEIDTAKKGEVARADFLKYRMKSFDELDANKDGKVSLEEFLKLAEPPYSNDVPGGPSLEERRNRIRSAFQNLDLNGSGFIERAEAEAPIQSEFNQYDTDRDDKITEPEIRLIMQRLAQRQAAERQQMEAEGRKKLVLIKFQEIDTNKDGIIDRPELTAYALKEFLATDLNKDRFLDQEEIKKFQEAEQTKTRDLIPKLMPPPAQPRPAAPQQRAPQPAPAPSGPPTGLPQGTR